MHRNLRIILLFFAVFSCFSCKHQAGREGAASELDTGPAPVSGDGRIIIEGAEVEDSLAWADCMFSGMLGYHDDFQDGQARVDEIVQMAEMDLDEALTDAAVDFIIENAEKALVGVTSLKYLRGAKVIARYAPRIANLPFTRRLLRLGVQKIVGTRPAQVILLRLKLPMGRVVGMAGSGAMKLFAPVAFPVGAVMFLTGYLSCMNESATIEEKIFNFYQQRCVDDINYNYDRVNYRALKAEAPVPVPALFPEGDEVSSGVVLDKGPAPISSSGTVGGETNPIAGGLHGIANFSNPAVDECIARNMLVEPGSLPASEIARLIENGSGPDKALLIVPRELEARMERPDTIRKIDIAYNSQLNKFECVIDRTIHDPRTGDRDETNRWESSQDCLELMELIKADQEGE